LELSPGTPRDDPPERAAVPLASTGLTDPEWQHLRVAGGDAVSAVLSAPQNTDMRRLVRSTTFNPRDTYLDPGARRDIEILIDRHQHIIEASIHEYRVACAEEFAGLNRQGRTVAVVLGERDSALRLRQIGAEPVFMVMDGVTHGTSLANLPRAIAAKQSIDGQAVDLCVALAEAFAAAGTLEDRERVEIVERALAVQGRKRR
jgi:hypothetical protein